MLLENDFLSVGIDESSGAIFSFIDKKTNCEFIGETRLTANFRICLPLEGYLCNYIEGMDHTPVSVVKNQDCVHVKFSGMHSEKGNYDIDFSYTICLKDDYIYFESELTNNTEHEISEFWFPRFGGWDSCFSGRSGNVAVPNYTYCKHNQELFVDFPGPKGLGAEAPEFSTNYPGMMMPWWDVYNAETNRGLYLGSHDPIFRLTTWHTYLFPTANGGPDKWLSHEQACGEPVGLVFSCVHYPFISNGETFSSGRFIFRVHDGDWHNGSQFYREWFMENFPFDKSDSWLRKKSAWFTSIIYQPEDKVVTDYEGYDQFCRDAEEYGVDCFELIGWDKGGLERDYPMYVPEKKLGGREGFRKLLKSIKARGSKCLVFVNYNVLDSATDWFKEELYKFQHQDQFGATPNWMAWGESTLLARKSISVRRHLGASVVPELEELLAHYFLDLVRDGADGFQFDKMNINNGFLLDFNPLNTEKPDVALFEGIVRAIERLLAKCREINPDFCFASEAHQDRLLPYVDVFYRNSNGSSISPLRYVFPEWTSCQHISMINSYNDINGAVLTGSVLCIEPESYETSMNHPLWKETSAYIKEVERIRRELLDIIFLGKYYDTLGAHVTSIGAQVVEYRVHGSMDTDKRAITVMNPTADAAQYNWEFLHRGITSAKLYAPFEPVTEVRAGEPIAIKPYGLHILVASC